MCTHALNTVNRRGCFGFRAHLKPKYGRYKNWRERQAKERYYRSEIKRVLDPPISEIHVPIGCDQCFKANHRSLR